MNNRKTVEQRFYEKVSHTDENGCWIWGSWTYPNGRPGMYFNGGNCHASRVAVFLATGKCIENGFCACHSCDNPMCVNPSHLWIGTTKENHHDSMAKGRNRPHFKTGRAAHNKRDVCINGHLVAGDNVYMRGNRRDCKECTRAAGRRYYARKQAKKLLAAWEARG